MQVAPWTHLGPQLHQKLPQVGLLELDPVNRRQRDDAPHPRVRRCKPHRAQQCFYLSDCSAGVCCLLRERTCAAAGAHQETPLLELRPVEGKWGELVWVEAPPQATAEARHWSEEYLVPGPAKGGVLQRRAGVPATA